jgi:two-component system LytT family response regulator
MKIRALIVEDEPLAASHLRSILAAETDIALVGVCESGIEAVRIILQHRPDLVFLDVQVPDLDGFDVLNEVREAGVSLPAIVFVTAHEQHALRAFEVHAVDFVLKPYGRERISAAVERVRQMIQRRDFGELATKVHALLDEVRSVRRTYMQRFAVRETGRVSFLAVSEVAWIGAEANRLMLHTAKGSRAWSGTLRWVEKRLDPACFVRISRSAIVNIRHVRELQTWFHGEYKVVLSDGTKLALTRTYRDRVPSLLGECSRTS